VCTRKQELRSFIILHPLNLTTRESCINMELRKSYKIFARSISRIYRSDNCHLSINRLYAIYTVSCSVNDNLSLPRFSKKYIENCHKILFRFHQFMRLEFTFMFLSSNFSYTPCNSRIRKTSRRKSQPTREVFISLCVKR